MIKLTVNNKSYDVEVEPDMPLLWFLRDVLHLTGTKFGCGMALCSACTVHLNGEAVRSCVTPVRRADNSRRSFCTNEYLSGTPSDLIMAISGHKSEKAFKKYIKADTIKKAAMIKKLWDE